MGMKFDSETFRVEIGDSIRETLKGILEAKGLGDRMEAGLICIIDDVTVKSVGEKGEITCEVEYEYE